MRVIKAGVMDDVELINNTKPGAELFAPERISWVPAVEGANQVDSVSCLASEVWGSCVLTATVDATCLE